MKTITRRNLLTQSASVVALAVDESASVRTQALIPANAQRAKKLKIMITGGKASPVPFVQYGA